MFKILSILKLNDILHREVYFFGSAFGFMFHELRPDHL